jgi:DNA-binding PadR family transcriptional regulator
MNVDYNAIDTVVNGPIRLGVLTALQIDGALDFTTLKRRLDASDGVIGSHLVKLEEAGYIRAQKRFVGRRPNTTYRITATGRRALATYLAAMQKVIDDVAAANGKA